MLIYLKDKERDRTMKITRCSLGIHRYRVAYKTPLDAFEYLECDLCGKRKVWQVFSSNNATFFKAPGTDRWLKHEFETMEQALEITKEEARKAFKEGRTIKTTGADFAKTMAMRQGMIEKECRNCYLAEDDEDMDGCVGILKNCRHHPKFIGDVIHVAPYESCDNFEERCKN